MSVLCGARGDDADGAVGVRPQRQRPEYAGLDAAGRAQSVSRAARRGRDSIGEGEGLFDKMNGIGAHEVIIESPRHDDTLASMDGARGRTACCRLRRPASRI